MPSNARDASGRFATKPSLRRCPFCDWRAGIFPGDPAHTFWIVRCGNPGCAVEMVDDFRGPVLAKWNRRPPDPTEPAAPYVDPDAL